MLATPNRTDGHFFQGGGDKQRKEPPLLSSYICMPGFQETERSLRAALYTVSKKVPSLSFPAVPLFNSPLFSLLLPYPLPFHPHPQNPKQPMSSIQNYAIIWFIFQECDCGSNIRKQYIETREMAPWYVKAHTTKPDDFSSTFLTHVVEGESQLLQVFL